MLKRAKLQGDCNLYTLRLSFATLTTEGGASSVGRSAQRGHTDADFTDEVYVTILTGRQKAE